MSTGIWTVLMAVYGLAALSCSSPTLALLRTAVPASPQALQAQARLSVVDWNAYDERENDGPGTYSFGYEIEDPASANTQFRQEERFANGTVSGSYGLVEPDGNVRIVTYVADAQGYRARIENSLRKEENYPRKTPTPVRPRPAEAPWPAAPSASAPASDRLLQTDNDVVDAEGGLASTPTPPLAWALLALQTGGGKRPPVQEQRQRPASATAPSVVRRQGPGPGPGRGGSSSGGVGGTEASQLQLLQQQLGLQNRRAWGTGTGTGTVGYHKNDVSDYAAYGGAAALATNDLSGHGNYNEGMYMSRGLGRGQRGQRDQSVQSVQSRRGRPERQEAWSANPIVVWPEPQAMPRYELLPPNPLLDKLIYPNTDGHNNDD